MEPLDDIDIYPSHVFLFLDIVLQLDPLMWTSYEALCEMGAVDIDPTSVFGVRPAEIDQLQEHLHKPQHMMPLQEKSVLSPSFKFHHGTPMDSMKPLQPMDLGTPSSVGSSIPKTSLFQTAQKTKVTPNQLQFETPNLTPIPHDQDASFVTHPDAATTLFTDTHNPSTLRRAKHVAARLYYQPSPETPDSAHRAPSRYLRGKSAMCFSDTSGSINISDTPVRRGGRPSEVSTARRPRALFMPSSENKTNNTNPDDENDLLDHAAPIFMRPEEEPHPEDEQDDNEKPMKTPFLEKNTTTAHDEDNIIEEQEDAIMDRHSAVKQVLELMCLLGAGYWRLCQYRCRDALQLFQALPHVQHNTGWVLHQEGRAYFEMADYQNAQRCLEMMQRVEPHRMKGLDLLSTVFWQLKKEVEIAHLAQRAVDFDRLAPEAWCVVGNCFSLQKEHETALVFFGRSLQLNPSFTYTHTLSGYEYMANEDFDKAVACFRNAIRSDERHYNAWYGLGAIYHRQEKYDLAEYHFHRAVGINPQSSVLRCNLGMSQYSNGKSLQALDTLAEAFRLDPHNPQARFQRATIYVALNRPEEALKELEKVRDAAPREATVHFSMGKVLKRLGRPEQAMRCFLTALDLDPKDNQLIKSAMDKLDEPDMDEEVAAF
jgi:anaphase-promoting complex subunit 3